MWETIDSLDKAPGDFLDSSSREILAIFGFVISFVEEDILFMSLKHIMEIVTEEQTMELFLIEWVYKVEMFFDFLGIKDLNYSEFVEFFIN